MDLREWDIADDWRDYVHPLEQWVKKRAEVMAAWLVGWHCTNGEIARILSALPDGEKMSERKAKGIVEALFKRMGVLDRGALSRRVRRLIESYRARTVPQVRGRSVRADDGRRIFRGAGSGADGRGSSGVSGRRG